MVFIYITHNNCIDPFLSNLSHLNLLNFHPLEVASRYRDPQLQVGGTDICLI